MIFTGFFIDDDAICFSIVTDEFHERFGRYLRIFFAQEKGEYGLNDSSFLLNVER